MKMITSIAILIALGASSSLFAFDSLESVEESRNNVLVADTLDVNGNTVDEEEEELSYEELIELARQKSERRNVKKIAKKISKMKISRTQVKQITAKESNDLDNNVGKLFGL